MKFIQEGYPEVILVESEENYDDYYGWIFTFRHTITEKTAWLGIHGYTDEEVSSNKYFTRVWWNDSSTANPKVEDWLTDDYTYKIVYIKK